MSQATTKKPRRTKMRAVQAMFHQEVLREEGEVFIYVGDKLPSSEIAVKADQGAEVAKPVPEVNEGPLKDAPEWTTAGFVKRANLASGRDEVDDEAL